MIPKQCLLSTIVITISISVSPIFTWNANIHRDESYNLERGPVFYEAYYPDNNDESHASYQEKRFFDREPILEKTYQVPPERIAYPENNVQRDSYQMRAETFPPREDRFVPETNSESVDIKEISKLARRAISRDLENWNSLENYLDRAKYQEPLYNRRTFPDPRYRVQQAIREMEPNFQGSFNQDRDPRRNLYDEIQKEPLNLSGRVQSMGNQRDQDVVRRMSPGDLVSRDFVKPYRPTRYEDQQSEEQKTVQTIRSGEASPGLSQHGTLSNSRSIMHPYPTENIFEPRPQVINYIFSKKPEGTTANNIQSVSEGKEKKESMPRNYGDNLIRDEMKKSEGHDKDVKVTSIEISEVPKHKTRHHHGEWPKRDYSRPHQN